MKEQCWREKGRFVNFDIEYLKGLGQFAGLIAIGVITGLTKDFVLKAFSSISSKVKSFTLRKQKRDLEFMVRSIASGKANIALTDAGFRYTISTVKVVSGLILFQAFWAHITDYGRSQPPEDWKNIILSWIIVVITIFAVYVNTRLMLRYYWVKNFALYPVRELKRLSGKIKKIR